MTSTNTLDNNVAKNSNILLVEFRNSPKPLPIASCIDDTIVEITVNILSNTIDTVYNILANHSKSESANMDIISETTLIIRVILFRTTAIPGAKALNILATAWNIISVVLTIIVLIFLPIFRTFCISSSVNPKRRKIPTNPSLKFDMTSNISLALSTATSITNLIDFSNSMLNRRNIFIGIVKTLSTWNNASPCSLLK